MQTDSDRLENTHLKREFYEKRTRLLKLNTKIADLEREIRETERNYDVQKKERLSKRNGNKYEWEEMTPFSPGFLNAPAFRKLEAQYKEKIQKLIEETNELIRVDAEKKGINYRPFTIEQDEYQDSVAERVDDTDNKNNASTTSDEKTADEKLSVVEHGNEAGENNNASTTSDEKTADEKLGVVEHGNEAGENNNTNTRSDEKEADEELSVVERVDDTDNKNNANTTSDEKEADEELGEVELGSEAGDTMIIKSEQVIEDEVVQIAPREEDPVKIEGDSSSHGNKATAGHRQTTKFTKPVNNRDRAGKSKTQSKRRGE